VNALHTLEKLIGHQLFVTGRREQQSKLWLNTWMYKVSMLHSMHICIYYLYYRL
jgi:hypothetical protein